MHGPPLGGARPDRNQRSETAKFLIDSKFKIAGSPSRTIVVRLRSLGSNVIARNTAARTFSEP